MANDFTKSTLNYPVGSPTPIRRVALNRSPLTSDYKNFTPGDEWLDQNGNDWWKFVKKTGPTSALWVKIGSDTEGYPITPYVVGPLGYAGYQTIQTAINAAHVAGGGAVYIQYGTYTENLTLYTGVSLTGVEGNVDSNHVSITGTHTPPTDNGTVSFRNINFFGTTGSTYIFYSTAAGQCYMVFDTCNFSIDTDGYIFDMDNWVGPTGLFTGPAGIALTNSGDLSTAESGLIKNSVGGMTISLLNSYVGSLTGTGTQPMQLNGQLQLSISDVYCPIQLSGGTGSFIEQSGFHGVGITVSGSSTGTIANSNFTGLSTAAFTMSSSGDWNISHLYMDTSNNPAIDGAGAGTLYYGALTFPQNNTVAGTLTTSAMDTKPHATSGTTGTAVRGSAGFSSSHFTVTDGFVELAGGGAAIDSFTVPAGTSPVVPDAAGNIDLPAGNGFQFTGGTNAMTGDMVSPFTGDFTYSGTLTSETTLNVNPGSDIDTDVVTVTVTGSPKLEWVEAQNGFRFNTGLMVGDTVGSLSHVLNGATVSSDLEVHSQATQDLGGVTLHRHTSNALYGGHILSLRSDGTHAAPTIVSDGDVISRYLAAGYDGTYYSILGDMRFEVDGTPGTQDMPGRWVLETSPDGTQVPTEKMRVDNAGIVSLPASASALYVGTSSPTVPAALNIEKSSSGVAVGAEVRNTSNTASSDAYFATVVGGSSAGDPFHTFNVANIVNWAYGIRNSDNDAWYLTVDLTPPGDLTGTLIQKCTTAGEITQPLQPAFQAYLGTADSNVTGDGTPYYLGDTAIGNTLTEQYDQNSDFTPGASGGAFFTAPVTGIYQFYMGVMFDNLSAANTEIYTFILHSSGSTVYYGPAFSGAARTGGNIMRINNSTQISMTAADTVKFGVVVSGSTKTVNLNATSQVTWCYGSLLC